MTQNKNKIKVTESIQRSNKIFSFTSTFFVERIAPFIQMRLYLCHWRTRLYDLFFRVRILAERLIPLRLPSLNPKGVQKWQTLAQHLCALGSGGSSFWALELVPDEIEVVFEHCQRGHSEGLGPWVAGQRLLLLF